MSERLTDEQLREWRDRRDPSGQPIHSEPVVPLIDDILALRARVAELEAALLVDGAKSLACNARLEAALRFLFEETNWKSVDKDNMEFEGRVTCYQLAEARAALKDASQ